MRMDSLLLNEIQREMRFASTQAMIESQNHLHSDNQIGCTSSSMGEGGNNSSLLIYDLFFI
ncbi:hypothetical protein [Acinetobacter baumannii]|uniref:hypothetical protein n=1 Tax=Acinetobacter baumannii TaxID=470 RepID=UPI003A97DF39